MIRNDGREDGRSWGERLPSNRTHLHHPAPRDGSPEVTVFVQIVLQRPELGVDNPEDNVRPVTAVNFAAAGVAGLTLLVVRCLLVFFVQLVCLAVPPRYPIGKSTRSFCSRVWSFSSANTTKLRWWDDISPFLAEGEGVSLSTNFFANTN